MLKNGLKKLGITLEDEKHVAQFIAPKNHKKEHYIPAAFDLFFQMDLMQFVPFNGYNYALNIVSINTRYSDVEPIKTKTPEDVTDAFIEIMKRGKLKFKKDITYIYVDQGSEFKGMFAKLCDEIGIHLILTRAGYHNDQSIVESCNRLYKKLILTFLSVKSKTKKDYHNDWVSILHKTRDIINEHVENKQDKLEQYDNEKPYEFNIKNQKYKLGDRVRMLLWNPEALFDKAQKLHGKFRSGDKRFSDEIYKVDGLFINPYMHEVRYKIIDEATNKPIHGSFPASKLLKV